MIDGVAVKLGVVLVHDRCLDGLAAQDAAAMEPDAQHRGAQQQRHRHEDDEQPQAQRHFFACFLLFHRFSHFCNTVYSSVSTPCTR